MKGIYPFCARGGYSIWKYSDIANKCFYKSKRLFDELKAHDYEYCSECEIALLRLHENAMITTVFSSMAIEAFLNDYAATCLGDDLFYESFDKLSVIGKLELIVNFILHTSIDKSKAYYCYLKKLNQNRNTLVHSKSFQLNDSNNENAEIEFDEDSFFHNQKKDNEETSKAFYRNAKDALRTMKEIAILFGKHDSNSPALFVFFPFLYGYGIEEYPEEMRKTIFKEISLPIMEKR